MSAADYTKRERMRLAKAELLVHLAVTASRWGRYVTDTEPDLLPIAKWPDQDHPLPTLLRTYNLTGADLAKVLETLANELEGRAERVGYADHLDPVPAPPPTRKARP